MEARRSEKGDREEAQGQGGQDRVDAAEVGRGNECLGEVADKHSVREGGAALALAGPRFVCRNALRSHVPILRAPFLDKG